MNIVKRIGCSAALCLMVIILASPAFAADKAPTQVLVTNVRVFDGTSDKLTDKTNVLVENNLIKEISATAKAGKDATVIDGGGRVLMPGLIDAHAHIWAFTGLGDLLYSNTWDYLGARMAVNAERYLMRGFTTVRDAGGPAFGVKKAIDEGFVKGPRIFPSGAYIGQTSGHGDWRTPSEGSFFSDDQKTISVKMGMTITADGVQEVQRAVRENFRMQASQIKVFTGGGVMSQSDPLDTNQYTQEELKAIVAETERWGTYVMSHAHTDASAIWALDAGIKSLEHASALSEETVKRVVKEGAFMVQNVHFTMQPIESNKALTTPVNIAKMKSLQAGMVNTLKWAKKYGAKLAFGTDAVGSEEALENTMLEFTARAPYFTPVEILQQATGNTAELLSWSKERSPYKEGALGVIKPGAYADLLIVEGNPVEDINVMVDYENNFKVIMKDGKVYKNTL